LTFYYAVFQYNYLVSSALFLIGLYTILTRKNLIKKVMGLNIMETSVFLFFISMGSVKGGRAPIVILGQENVKYVNPIPQALVLTAIVIAVSVTGFALALIIKIYGDYGTLDADRIRELREEPR
jgi:multicomponent Na+:H+ antiporter subunit C